MLQVCFVNTFVETLTHELFLVSPLISTLVMDLSESRLARISLYVPLPTIIIFTFKMCSCQMREAVAANSVRHFATCNGTCLPASFIGVSDDTIRMQCDHRR
jgi:hypothetical protein